MRTRSFRFLVALLACSLCAPLFAPSPGFAAKKTSKAGKLTKVTAQGPRFTMMNSVDAALAYNPELKATQEGRQMTEHAVRKAQAGYLPTISAFAGAGASRLSDSTTRSYREDNDFRSIADAGLRLTQPVFHGFATTHAVAASKAKMEAAGGELEDRAMAIAFDAIAAHTEVVRRSALLKLAENNVSEHATILRTVNERYRSGIATDGELHQVKSRHARAQATATSYSSALDAAKANYLRVTGKSAGKLAPPHAPKRSFATLEKIRDTALERHPRLQASLAEVRAAQGEKGQAKSRFYPYFDLSAGPSWTDRSSKASLHTSEMVGELRMNWEFYSGGADAANVKMASAKVRQARQNLHALMNAINEDIESSFSRYKSSVKEASEYESAKKSSHLARDDYYLQFLNAQRSLIDVLDAENDYFYAASQEVLARTDRILAGYRLLALSGTLFDELKIDPKTLRVATPTTKDSTPDLKYDFDTPLARGFKKGLPQSTSDAKANASGKSAGK